MMTAERTDWTEMKPRARGRWVNLIFPALGIVVPDSPMRHGPCPMCGGTDRFRCDDKDGDGTWFCNGCEPHAGDGLSLVRHVKRCDFLSAVRLVADVLGHGNGNAPRRATQPSTEDPAKCVWGASGTDSGAIACYLTSRGLSGKVPESLRLHPALKYWEPTETELRLVGKFPAMLAQIVAVEGYALGVHATYLSVDGAGKAQVSESKKTRKYLDARTISGGAIRLAEFEPGKPLVLAEGIETGLAIHEATDWPVWACISAAGLESVQLPAECQDIIIGADLDASEAGQQAAEKCAARLRNEGRNVRIVLPSGPIPEGKKGVDWLDILAEQGAAAVKGAFEAAPLPLTLEEPLPVAEPWPELDQTALHGLAGEVVRLLDPHTEADPAALLVSFLAEIGCMLGRAPHLSLDGSYHPLLFWPVLVGQSSKSRKGTAGRRIQTLLQLADSDWTRGDTRGTLSSGEGLVFAVRDPQFEEIPVKDGKRITGETVTSCVDKGIEDKRLYLVQSEFGSVLRVMAREGNSLSGVLRDAWDGLDLAPMTKGNRIRATAPHIGLCGHVTRDELLRNLTDTEASNGFGNRFAWVAVKRSKELPFPSSPDQDAMAALARRIGRAIRDGRSMGALQLTTPARNAWESIYSDLSADRPGLAGALLGRAEAQVMRLAALYALLDGQSLLDVPHLEAACALWGYIEASTVLVFGDSTGDAVSDTILRGVREAEDGLNDTQINSLFHRHQSALRLERAKTTLQTAGLIHPLTVETSGRPQRLWKAGAKKAKEAK